MDPTQDWPDSMTMDDAMFAKYAEQLERDDFEDDIRNLSCSIRQLVEARRDTTLTIVEKSDSIGGNWNGKEDSPVYPGVHTNLPKELMAFPDLDFEEESKSFVHHTSVRKYLRQYADKFNLQQVKYEEKKV